MVNLTQKSENFLTQSTWLRYFLPHFLCLNYPCFGMVLWNHCQMMQTHVQIVRFNGFNLKIIRLSRVCRERLPLRMIIYPMVKNVCFIALTVTGFLRRYLNDQPSFHMFRHVIYWIHITSGFWLWTNFISANCRISYEAIMISRVCYCFRLPCCLFWL